LSARPKPKASSVLPARRWRRCIAKMAGFAVSFAITKPARPLRGAGGRGEQRAGRASGLLPRPSPPPWRWASKRSWRWSKKRWRIASALG
jgi:hypothetical protein